MRLSKTEQGDHWNFSGEDRKTRHLRECWRIGTRRERRIRSKTDTKYVS